MGMSVIEEIGVLFIFVFFVFIVFVVGVIVV